MPELSDTVATPDGIDFAYQLAAEKLSSQLDIIDRLDAKVGALIGALVTAASRYTATAKSAIACRGWANPPNPIRLSDAP
jgi:hypothetical protein